MPSPAWLFSFALCCRITGSLDSRRSPLLKVSLIRDDLTARRSVIDRADVVEDGVDPLKLVVSTVLHVREGLRHGRAEPPDAREPVHHGCELLVKLGVLGVAVELTRYRRHVLDFALPLPGRLGATHRL